MFICLAFLQKIECPCWLAQEDHHPAGCSYKTHQTSPKHASWSPMRANILTRASPPSLPRSWESLHLLCGWTAKPSMVCLSVWQVMRHTSIHQSAASACLHFVGTSFLSLVPPLLGLASQNMTYFFAFTICKLSANECTEQKVRRIHEAVSPFESPSQHSMRHCNTL